MKIVFEFQPDGMYDGMPWLMSKPIVGPSWMHTSRCKEAIRRVAFTKYQWPTPHSHGYYLRLPEGGGMEKD